MTQTLTAPTIPTPILPTPPLDTSFKRARPIVTRSWDTVHIVIVGVGGTGSWLATHAARLVRVIIESGKKASLTLIDHDIVERANIYRQNFCDADIDVPKVEALAMRLELAWAIPVAAIKQRFSPYLLEDYPYRSYRSTGERLTVICSCVDNAEARKSVFKVLESNSEREAPRYWILDCGNFVESGQVLLGSAPTVESMRHAFKFLKQCITVPSPALQAPNLLVPQPEELAENNLSCEQIAIANAQGLMINSAIAYEAADYLVRLLITGGLRRFATYIDLPSGRKTSQYTTPKAFASVIGRESTFFTETSKR